MVILLDDIGFGGASAFGGVIETPHIDKLASQGLMYNQFHTTALCSPTRQALKTGRNAEVATSFPGATGMLPNDVAGIGEVLRLNGYSTGAFGKWHETAVWEISPSGPFTRWPNYQGFDEFYGFLGGETNQWVPGVFHNLNRVETPDGPDYHFMIDMATRTIDWIRFQQSLTPDKPFFVYFATGAVHAPHHVPKSYIDKQEGRFDEGWDVIRERIFEQQKKLGVIPIDTKLAPKPADIKDWKDLSAKEQKLIARQAEVFAAYFDMAIPSAVEGLSRCVFSSACHSSPQHRHLTNPRWPRRPRRGLRRRPRFRPASELSGPSTASRIRPPSRRSTTISISSARCRRFSPPCRAPRSPRCAGACANSAPTTRRWCSFRRSWTRKRSFSRRTRQRSTTSVWLNTKEAPLVIELPPNGLGFVDDFWFRWDGDVGVTGAGKGKGGKYLLLPPGYKGPVPEGYFVLRSPTYNNWFLARLFWRRRRRERQAGPADLSFGKRSESADDELRQRVWQVLQHHWLDRFLLLRGRQRGRTGGAECGDGPRYARSARLDRHRKGQAVQARRTDEEGPHGGLGSNSAWGTPFVGGSYQFLQDGVRNVDARTFFFMATGITPAMSEKMVGKGSQYAVAFVDSGGAPLDGGKAYKLHLPPNIPAKQFWSLIAYSSQSRSMLQTDQQYPKVGSQTKGLVLNTDTSVDVYFGPTVPAGKENNWVQTVPGKGWNVMLRLYGPLEPWFNKTWRPGEIELVK
jgi:hypothetical protein